MTGAQLALASGALVSLGVVLAVWRLVPATPDLNDVVTRLSPQQVRQQRTTAVEPASTSAERLGLWAMRHLPAGVWGTIPTRELALVRVSLPRYYGEKVTFALLGLVFPGLFVAVVGLFGFALPVVIPVLVSVALAGMLWFVPNLNVRSDARRARLEFNRALGAYVDLVALERNAGSGPRQAMEVAAGIGHSWVFTRLSEELARSRWSGEPPWDALTGLADELGVSELADLADIMRLSGEEGAQVYATLRARSSAMRTAILTGEQGEANEISERMVVPGSLLGVVFIALLLTPALLRLFTA
ncbi:MAG: type II secretion system F family protein [Nigerium sp.]|nr:type II secretion system F family protein [Nigerium sp.]